MPFYDVEFKVTIRTEDPHIEEARTYAFLTLEEHLFGGVHVSNPDESDAEGRAFVDKRFDETGFMMQVVDAERVVTPQPYALS